jgi:Spy/CpxP family protein refolding chaperone
MKMKVPGIFLAALLAVLVCADYSWTQDMGPGMGFGKRHGMDFEEHARNLDNLRLLKLLETLDLSGDQNERFIAAFSKYRKESREAFDLLQAHVDTLVNMLNSEKPDDKGILKEVAEIEQLKDQQLTLRKKMHDEVAEFLTPVQVGKLVVFDERFERELLERVRGFRRQGPPGEGEDYMNSKF